MHAPCPVIHCRVFQRTASLFPRLSLQRRETENEVRSLMTISVFHASVLIYIDHEFRHNIVKVAVDPRGGYNENFTLYLKKAGLAPAEIQYTFQKNHSTLFRFLLLFSS